MKKNFYRIELCGSNKQLPFYDDEDKEKFLSILKQAKEKFDYNIYAYCVSSKVAHFLLSKKNVSIKEFMWKVVSDYTFWYNNKYEITAKLFKGNFIKESIEYELHLCWAVRHVFQNSLQIGDTENISDYAFSSYGCYWDDKQNFVDIIILKSYFETKEKYVSFMTAPNEFCYGGLIGIGGNGDAYKLAREEFLDYIISQSDSFSLFEKRGMSIVVKKK